MAVNNTEVTIAGRGSWPTSAEPIAETTIGEHQRERILAAAIDLFSKRGYHDTSAERICKKAGVSFPTFRKHFRDREECFLAAFDESVDGALGRVMEAVARSNGDWGSRVVVGLDTVLASVAGRPAEARLCLVEVLSAGSAGIERYDAAVRRFSPWLRAGREEMEDSSGLPEVLEETILAGVAWAIHQKVAIGEAAEAAELRAGLLGTLLTPYLGQDRSRSLIEREPAKD
jgi:AcrR family transcriptional regulator